MDPERLGYMANQIARNFAVRGEEAAVVATAEHIRAFWDPRMIADLLASQISLEPIAAAAKARLGDK